MDESEKVRVDPLPLEQLREALHKKVEDGLLRMTSGSGEDDPYQLDFTGREALALELAKDIGAALLEANVLRDRDRINIEASASWQCPRCGRDCPRETGDDGEPHQEVRDLTTRVGSLRLISPAFYCTRCRRRFFPLRNLPQSRPRDL